MSCTKHRHREWRHSKKLYQAETGHSPSKNFDSGTSTEQYIWNTSEFSIYESGEVVSHRYGSSRGADIIIEWKRRLPSSINKWNQFTLPIEGNDSITAADMFLSCKSCMKKKTSYQNSFAHRVPRSASMVNSLMKMFGTERCPVFCWR